MKTSKAKNAGERSASSTGWAATLSWLRARAVIAADLWREGRIERTECFRLEMDAALERDTGPVEYKPNREYEELLKDGWKPKRPNQQLDEKTN